MSRKQDGPPTEAAPFAYRADIDGLRAIAVLSVVVYHAFPGLLPGGFVGVDMFFVISGYLISSILLNSFAKSTFHFSSFYWGRVQRLFPALVVVLGFCFVVGAYLLSPQEFRALGWQSAAGAFFYSNFAYWAETGYFDAASQTKPLLHLWSLAVEEQFYLVWPLMIFCVRRRANLYAPLVAILFAVSFTVNMVLSLKASPWFEPSADYYLPLSRFWEIMLGALLSSASARLYVAKRKSKWLSAGGAFLVMVSLVAINAHNPYPGAFGLVPTLGTIMLIAAGPNGIVNRRVLSNSALVRIGLISYPLYLWHWPLLSFSRIVAGEAPGLPIRLAAVALAVIFAWATYQLVERPLRFGALKRHAAGPLASALLAAGLLGFAVSINTGWSPAQTVRTLKNGDFGHGDFQAYLFANYLPCDPPYLRRGAPVWGRYVRCYQSRRDNPLSMAIIGDSHAEHLFPGLASIFPALNVVYYTRSGLPDPDSHDFEPIYRYVANNPHIQVVVLSAYWAQKIANSVDKHVSTSLLKGVDLLQRAGKKVVIVEDLPDFPFDPEKCKYARPFGHHLCTVAAAPIFSKQERSRAVIDAVSHENHDVTVFDPSPGFCAKGLCSMSVGDDLLFRDRNHLNLIGSRYVATRLVSAEPAVFAGIGQDTSDALGSSRRR